MTSNAHISPSELHAANKTNPSSKFEHFQLKLANGATLTGISYIPTKQPISSTAKPLLVGIHGATCSAYTWDVSENYTASTYSELTGIPFVAFNRPNFLDSSGWLVDRASSTPTQPKFTATEGKSYFEEEAQWFDEYIFPALWESFAKPNNCSAIVTTSHSMAVPATIIAGGLYNTPNPARKYIWAGQIITGFGEVSTKTRENNTANAANITLDKADIPITQDETIHIPPFTTATKQALMLGPQGLCDDSLAPLIAKGTTPFLTGEIMDMVVTWPASAAEHKSKVHMPVLHALGSHDWIWKADRQTVDLFLADFKNSSRLEGAVVEGAPHAIELSRVGASWWMRAFGWAGEVAASLEVKKLGIPVFE